MSLCLGKSGSQKQNFSYFFSLKNVMEYSLPEGTIGAKWECV